MICHTMSLIRVGLVAMCLLGLVTPHLAGARLLFNARAEYEVGRHPASVAMGDMDGDGVSGGPICGSTPRLRAGRCRWQRGVAFVMDSQRGFCQKASEQGLFGDERFEPERSAGEMT